MTALKKTLSTTILLAALAAILACVGGPRLPDEPDSRLRAVGENPRAADLQGLAAGA